MSAVLLFFLPKLSMRGAIQEQHLDFVHLCLIARLTKSVWNMLSSAGRMKQLYGVSYLKEKKLQALHKKSGLRRAFLEEKHITRSGIPRVRNRSNTSVFVGNKTVIISMWVKIFVIVWKNCLFWLSFFLAQMRRQ